MKQKFAVNMFLNKDLLQIGLLICISLSVSNNVNSVNKCFLKPVELGVSGRNKSITFSMRIVYIKVQSVSLYLDAITINYRFNDVYLLVKDFGFLNSGPGQQVVKMAPSCAEDQGETS